MDNIEALLAQGYTFGEAELIAHVVRTAEADRARALHTGRCTCGGHMVCQTAHIECARCGEAFVA